MGAGRGLPLAGERSSVRGKSSHRGTPHWQRFQDRLASVEALPQLALLAVLAGLATAGVMLLFEYAIEAAAWLLRGEHSENFNMPPAARLLTPVLGALAIGLAMGFLPPDRRCVGVAHVMERLARHHGRMTWQAGAWQFAGGVAGLATGLSGGKEGPAVHLGATASSLLGQALTVPNNCVRSLVACGSAAAIAASFNTPLAGVVFAMEVVMMEYTIASFIPVILSAVTATVVYRGFHGDATVFEVSDSGLASLFELPYIVLAGLVVGIVGAGFIALVKVFASLDRWPFWMRGTVAGGITGLLALLTPAVLGVGYDTIADALAGELLWQTLLLVLVAKTLASAACVGAGLPVGTIGPALVMGAMLGGLLGDAGNALAAGEAADPALYVILGMGAMMAAVLQAPLAALVAVLELTADPAMILPAMLIIVVATLTVSQLFKQRSVLLATLEALGVRYPPDPAAQHLARTGTLALMDAKMAVLPLPADRDDARTALANDPAWIALTTDAEHAWVIGADALAESADVLPAAGRNTACIPGARRAAFIDSDATLLQALDALDAAGVDLLCVRRVYTQAIIGVLTRRRVEDHASITREQRDQQ